MLEQVNLALFFTQFVGLTSWERWGMFDREVALYREMQGFGAEIAFITHGKREDLEYAHRLQGIDIRCNRWGLPGRIYRPLINALHRRALKKATVIKSNQIQGAELALIAAQRYRKPLVIRCGYLFSDFQEREHGIDSTEASQAHDLERLVFTGADLIILTTEAMRRSVTERFPETESRIEIIPNYVDTHHFCPQPGHTDPAKLRLVTVGRLNQQKNIAALIEAVAPLDVELDIIGEGEERERLEAMASDLPHVRLLGAVPHTDLPDHLRAATAYIQPTLYEGHPKTIIEAMACGAALITTDTPGVGDMLTHGENAWLCETSAESLRAGIETVLGDTGLRRRLGDAGHRFATENYALDKIAARELALHRKLIAEKRKA